MSFHPFHDVPPITKVTSEHLVLLADWISELGDVLDTGLNTIGTNVWQSPGKAARKLWRLVAGPSRPQAL